LDAKFSFVASNAPSNRPIIKALQSSVSSKVKVAAHRLTLNKNCGVIIFHPIFPQSGPTHQLP